MRYQPQPALPSVNDAGETSSIAAVAELEAAGQAIRYRRSPR